MASLNQTKVLSEPIFQTNSKFFIKNIQIKEEKIAYRKFYQGFKVSGLRSRDSEITRKMAKLANTVLGFLHKQIHEVENTDYHAKLF